MSDDISLEVIKLTQNVLGKFVKRPPLTEKLLRKPPFKFLHDVIMCVIRDTGFLKGLFTAEEMKHENIKDRDGKISFLQKLIDALKEITGETLTARPSKIVAGHEPVKTNELLQAIGKALQNNLSSAEYVESLSKSKKAKPETIQQNAGAKAKISSEKRTIVKGKTVKEKQKAKVSSVTKKLANGKTSAELKSESLKNEKDASVHVEPLPATNESEINNTNDINLEDQNNVSDAVQPDDLNHIDVNENALETVDHIEILNNSKEILDLHPEISNKIANVSNVESPLPTQQKNTEGEQKRPQSAFRGNRKSAVKHSESQNNLTDSADTVMKLETNTEVSVTPLLSTSDIVESKPIEIQSTKSFSPVQNNVPRPASVRRSARPSSARPAAPRIRDRGEVMLVEEIPQVTGKVNVIFENNDLKEQDEDENFVVVETETISVEPSESPADTSKLVEEGEHGHLVSQILETQKELEDNHLTANKDLQSKKVEIEWEGGRVKEREMVQKDVSRLRSSIQTLTRAANPLGKLMDYLHEDIDSMQRELKNWQNVNKEVAIQLHREQSLTSQVTDPLKLKLQELEENIVQQLDQISSLKSTILRNDEKIKKLLIGN